MDVVACRYVQTRAQELTVGHAFDAPQEGTSFGYGKESAEVRGRGSAKSCQTARNGDLTRCGARLSCSS